MGTLQVRRLGYALGAEITGVDLTEPLDDETLAKIWKIWLDNIVVCFPGQNLTAEQMMAFCGRFGRLDDHRHMPDNRHPDYATVKVFSNQRIVDGQMQYGTRTGLDWHSDHYYTIHPSTATFLLAKELPDVGGNTMWTNMAAAYDALSPKMKEIVEGLSAIHDRTLSLEYSSPEAQAADRKLKPAVVHGAVLVHPETGRKVLYTNDRIRQFLGMTEEETKPLVDFLMQHVTRYEFVYRHRWSVNDLVMWDNRSSMHIAVQDYDNKHLRRMLRCTLLGPQTGYILDRNPEAVRATELVAG